MALYRHVANKDELLLLMADAAFADVRLPDPAPRGWRARMEAGARLQWALYQRHPWLAQYLSVTRPQPTRNGMALIEWTMARVEGLDPLTLIHMAITLLNYVRATAAGFEDDLEAEQETGMDQSAWLAAMEPAYESILRSGSYPMYAGIDELEGDVWCPWTPSSSSGWPACWTGWGCSFRSGPAGTGESGVARPGGAPSGRSAQLAPQPLGP